MTATEYAALDARVTRLETIAAVLKELPSCRTWVELNHAEQDLAAAFALTIVQNPNASCPTLKPVARPRA